MALAPGFVRVDDFWNGLKEECLRVEVLKEMNVKER